MNILLTESERKEFKILVRKTRNINERNRLCAILAYDTGHSVEDIVDILNLSQSSIYDYIRDYESKHKICNDKHLGKDCKLSIIQEEELKSYLSTNTFIKAKDIAQYILQKYQIKYSTVGIIKWLNRNGFAYKKPKHVPGKLDEKKQQEFVEYYNNLKQEINTKDEIIMFMDAVHPEYQSQAVYGWIPKGETKTLPMTNTQFRMHLNGAINLNTMDIFTREYDTIDGQSVISFLKDLEAKYPDKTLHIICDNGRSNKNKEIQEFLTNSRIQIHYLPPYSPNLNAIERLWKVMRERTTYNKYYAKFAEFKDKINEFFSVTVDEIKDVLAIRINDNFEMIRHNSVQIAS